MKNLTVEKLLTKLQEIPKGDRLNSEIGLTLYTDNGSIFRGNAEEVTGLLIVTEDGKLEISISGVLDCIDI